MKTIRPLIAAVSLVSLCACTHLTTVPTGGGASGESTGGYLSQRVAAPVSLAKAVSFSVLQDYPKGEDIKDVVQDFQLMKELGVNTWRGSFSWIDYEPQRGTFDYAWLHRFVALAKEQGITLRPYLAYTPAWAARGGKDKEVWNDPPRSLDDWRSFVSRTVKELKGYGNIRSYEIYNEENVKLWWEGSAADYNQVLRAGSDVVKGSAPGTQVIMGGMVWPDYDWVKAACVTYGNAGKFDIVPFHAYPETWTPANITVENYLDQGLPGYFHREFLPLVNQGCAGQPIWINEAGFATPPGKSELDQANWWARAIATFLADPRVEHLGIYQIRDRRPESKIIGESENYYLGLTRADRQKKLAFYTVKRLINLLNTGKVTVADAELAVEVTGGMKGELYHHLFVRPDGKQVLIVWDKKGNPTLQIKIRKGSKAVEYALDGKQVPVYSFDGRTFSFDGRSLQNVTLAPGMVRIFEIR